MNTQALKTVRRLFNVDYVPKAQNRHNQRAWVRSVRILGDRWRNSIYAGVILAQIGEFSFVLAAVGHKNDLINEYGYQVSVAVIALSLLISPTLISVTRRLQLRRRPQNGDISTS